MELQTKTPVQIIQELITIHTTRIEVIDKFQARVNDSSLSDNLLKAKMQSELFVSQLMSELSNFGDSIMASVDSEDEYQLACKNVFGEINEMEPPQIEAKFLALETVLKNTYAGILTTKINLPESVQVVLVKQEGAL